MRKLVLIAAMLMASASAQAGSYSFKVEGQQVRINVPRGCSSLSCINVSAPGLTDKLGHKEDTASTPAPATTATATAAAAPAAAAPAPAPAPAPEVAAPAPTAPAAVAPAPAPQTSSKVTVLTAPDAASTPAPAVSAPSLTAPQVSVQPAPAPAPVQVAAAPASAAAPAPAPARSDSPIGVWLSEKKEGKVRIEDCNGDLCGYAVDAKTGANGAKVLMNMKPRGDKWAGRIKDTRSGGIYDSTIALRGSDKLKVQGCAFGGMFCGGETWSRVE
jgi:uncharacterized protein (DUF2147 family)